MAAVVVVLFLDGLRGTTGWLHNVRSRQKASMFSSMAVSWKKPPRVFLPPLRLTPLYWFPLSARNGIRSQTIFRRFLLLQALVIVTAVDSPSSLA